MALYSPFQKKKKPATAFDALKPQATATPAPPATSQPSIFPPPPKQPATAQTALASGTPPPPIPTLPGRPVVSPVIPESTTGGGAPQTTQPPATGGGYMEQERARIAAQQAQIAARVKQLRDMSQPIPGMSMQERLNQANMLEKSAGGALQNEQNLFGATNTDTTSQQAQIDQFNQYVQDELKKQGIPIPDAASVQNNPAYQAAIEAMKSGKSLEDAAALFRQGLPSNYNFKVGDANFTPNKGTIGDVNQTNIPTINKGEQINVGGTMINRTDLEKLLSGDNGLANTASKAALDNLLKTLKDGGALSQEDMQKLLEPFTKDSLARQGAAESNALGALSARGFGTNAAAVTGGLSEIGRQYEAERTQKESDLLKENLMAGITGKQTAIKGLSDLAAQERQARISAAEIGSKENIAQAGLTSEEKMKQADLQFAQDELFQNGQLTQAGLSLKQNLETYGLQLEKYKTDQGYDLELARQDLTKQLAQAGLDVDSAKLQADNVFKSLDVAIADKKIDAEVNTAIAELQQRAASGDRDAQFKVDSLRVEQNLRQQGLDHELSMFTADLAYKIMSGREKLDAEMFVFLKELDAKLKQQNAGGGLGGFLGKIVGTVVGSAAGGVGAAVGNYIGGQLGGA